MIKTALITGASSGIGRATAMKLASLGYRLILVARRLQSLEKLSVEIGQQFDIPCLPVKLDVCDSKAVKESIENLPTEWRSIDVLINNAGLAAGLDIFSDASLEDWEAMIDTNIKGLLYISKAISPLMAETGGGHIINIGSIAGKEVYPKGNVYCGTKHFVDAITQSMRMELLPFGIKVSQIAPGAIETEFSLVRFKGDVDRAKHVYQGFQPLQADDIAEAIAFILDRPGHVCINDMVIMPTAQATATIIKRD